VLTANDPLVGVPVATPRVFTADIQKSSLDGPSTDIPLDEIRRQNDVERWRNKLRLQEKFQV
jgi:hypothetical protein